MVAAEVMKHRLGRLADPYHQGGAGRWARVATACTASGAALLVLPGRLRGERRSQGMSVGTSLGAALVVAGGICQRWAVFRAGFASAADPRYTVGPQRERRRAQAG